MQSLYDIPAPAKLNLFLHITGRRADGYHLLQSAFMLIDWCDTLHFALRRDGQISREDLNIPLPADDLNVRAARALQQATGCTQGAHIGVLKSIPAQAGMGGGSSDAASTLLALNRLWGLDWPRERLQVIVACDGSPRPVLVVTRWEVAVPTPSGSRWVPWSRVSSGPKSRLRPRPQSSRDAPTIMTSAARVRATRRFMSGS